MSKFTILYCIYKIVRLKQWDFAPKLQENFKRRGQNMRKLSSSDDNVCRRAVRPLSSVSVTSLLTERERQERDTPRERESCVSVSASQRRRERNERHAHAQTQTETFDVDVSRSYLCVDSNALVLSLDALHGVYPYFLRNSSWLGAVARSCLLRISCFAFCLFPFFSSSSIFCKAVCEPRLGICK